MCLICRLFSFAAGGQAFRKSNPICGQRILRCRPSTATWHLAYSLAKNNGYDTHNAGCVCLQKENLDKTADTTLHRYPNIKPSKPYQN